MAETIAFANPFERYLLEGEIRHGSATSGIELRGVPFPGVLTLRIPATAIESLAAAASALGIALPISPGTTATNGKVTALWTGPDEWLVTNDDDIGGSLAALRGVLAGRHAAVTDVSDGLAAIEVSGTRAIDLLRKGCGIDLHPRAFVTGRCARTGLAQVTVVLHRLDDEPRFRLYVDRSAADYLWAWLADAAQEFLGD